MIYSLTKFRPVHLLGLLTLVLLTYMGALTAFAQPEPLLVEVELGPGESVTVDKLVHTTALPPASDFVFLADTTGSMGPSINDVKANAQAIIDAIEGAGATDARYGVGNYRDFPSPACGYGFELDTDLTDAEAAKAAIDTWAPNLGCDQPEANLFALHRTAVHDINWREDASARFIIWFGDAPGHDPLCPALPGYTDEHTVTETSAIADLLSEEIHVIAVTALSGPGLDADPKPISTDYPPPCAPDEQGNGGQATRIAAATGGVHLINPPGTAISETIIDAIEALPAIEVLVTPVVTCDAGVVVTFDPPAQTVESGATAEFDETITLTTGVAGSTLECTVTFTGAPGEQQIIVTVVPGAPATLTLEPAADENPVDAEHCVTATVEDISGNPVPGAEVDFSVSGAVTTGGEATTDANGEAEFCYTGPALPGADVIEAFADTDADDTQDPGEPADVAEKTWVLPASSGDCKVTYGGTIIAANGDRANFGGNALEPEKGQHNYRDNGPAQDMHVKSIEQLVLVCSADGASATIFGMADVDGFGEGEHLFRIDVRDLGEPGRNDRYHIQLSNGYDSGDQQLRSGNVQIH